MSILCRSLYAYWETIRGARAMPSRSDFEPLDVPKLLPYVFLLDVQQEPLDFHYRIVGETIIRFSGQNLMGQWASALDRHRDPSPVWALLRNTVNDRVPRLIHFSYSAGDITVSHLPVLALPLSDDGITVNKIVGMVDYAECIEKRLMPRQLERKQRLMEEVETVAADGTSVNGPEKDGGALGDDNRQSDATFYNAL
ncbi:PAS domain-containing protein [Aestuariispira insulae]|nr:PAS domain-containing protein [Aestuariispira insulae]